MHADTPNPGTCARLLEAAGEVFALHGYKGATVREICRRATANIAAVNYHFGGKEGLYIEVVKYAARCALEKYPIGGGVSETASAPEKLAACVRNHLSRLMDEGRPAWHGQLMSREMTEPTKALDDLVEQFMRPQYERLRGIVAEILGDAATPDRVRRCSASVMAQCVFYKHVRPALERLIPEQGFGPADREELVEHITAFSLRAIDGVRREAQGGTESGRRPGSPGAGPSGPSGNASVRDR
jgi:TetR/AcrR family transcriptional regulator, regulator of cefoperazone and chloramphenicol sensitivity